MRKAITFFRDFYMVKSVPVALPRPNEKIILFLKDFSCNRMNNPHALARRHSPVIALVRGSRKFGFIHRELGTGGLHTEYSILCMSYRENFICCSCSGFCVKIWSMSIVSQIGIGDVCPQQW